MSDAQTSFTTPTIEPHEIAPVTLGIDAEAAWRPLVMELDSWATSGQTVTLWWRDDDAVDVTPALERLRALSEKLAVPVALAVIPVLATPALAAYVGGWPLAEVLQHGYDHRNHSDAGKKAELSANRPVEGMIGEVLEGGAHITHLFGRRALPVLVPPWNRISAALAAALPGFGYRGLSGFHSNRTNAEGLCEVNAHIDVVNWRGKEFAGERAAIESAVRHLRSRRLDNSSRDEPTGLLTHHLVLDEAAWTFVERFLAVTSAHSAVRWLDARVVFELT